MDFTSALAAWRNVNLPGLQSHLDSVVGPLTDLQTQSLQSRKQLADKTREFKKLSDEAKLEGYKPLLKAYQAEIDGLTRRAREAEGSIRRVDERLRGVADPYAILNVVIDQTTNVAEFEALKIENARLTSAVEKLKGEAASASEIRRTSQQLSEHLVTLEQSFEAKLQEARSSAEAEITARLDERLSNAQAKESELSRSLSIAQEQLKQLRASHENATERLLTSSSSAAGVASSSAAEYEMLAEDLQRARERVATVEKRNEQLREEVEKVKSGQADDPKVLQLQMDLKCTTDEKNALQTRIDCYDEKYRETIENLEKKAETAERLLREMSQEVADLHTKLEAQADYNELKRELQIMRLVEFSNGIDDDEDANGEQAAQKSGTEPLEVLLLKKNRKLQDELTTLRVSFGELEQKSYLSAQEKSQLDAEMTCLRQLNEKLESDLLAIGPNSENEGVRNGAQASAGSGHRQQQRQQQSAEEALEEIERIGNGQIDFTTPSIGADHDGTPAQEASRSGDSKSSSYLSGSVSNTDTSSLTSAFQATSDSSVLPIIISQRDRFRSRNAELEEELRKQFETVTQLRNNVKDLQSDNLSLYEKVRYLQSYSGSGATSGSGAVVTAARNEHRFPSSSSASSPRHHRVEAIRVPLNLASASATGEDKWRERYEQSMNPFEAFRGREKSRVLSSLNPLERLLHVFTRLVFTDRRMRLLFVCYSIGMHVFVFAVLVDYTFYGSSTSSEAAIAAAAAAANGHNCAAPMDPVVDKI